jgi:hypothetical protein
MLQLHRPQHHSSNVAYRKNGQKAIRKVFLVARTAKAWTSNKILALATTQHSTHTTVPQHLDSSTKLRLIQLQINLDDNDSNETVYKHTKWKSELKNLRTIRKAAYDYHTIHIDCMIRQYQVEASLLSPEDTHELKDIRKKIRSRVERIISNEQMRQLF